MSLNDIYKVVLKGETLGKDTVNVFHYRQATSSPALGAGDLLTAFDTLITPNLINIVSVASFFTETDVYNLNNLSDLYEYVFPTPIQGDQAGDCLPPFATWNFKYPRTTLGVKSGRKGFAGVSEPNQSNGVVTSGFLTALATMAGHLESSISVGSGTYDAGYVSFISSGLVRPTPLFVPASGVAYTHIGTQNSRKF
jgi:hypothetical protein